MHAAQFLMFEIAQSMDVLSLHVLLKSYRDELYALGTIRIPDPHTKLLPSSE